MKVLIVYATIIETKKRAERMISGHFTENDVCEIGNNNRDQ